ncbi:MAG: hypothetical protein IKV35_03270 [Clostridia bacterium]|nr:hypothetical protein [Clostridia bacterium]
MAIVWTVLTVIGWILLGVLALLLLILFTPFGIRFRYTDSWSVCFYLFGFLPIFRLTDEGFSKLLEKAGPSEAPPVNEKPPETVEKQAENRESTKDEKTSILDDFKQLYKERGVGGVLAFFRQLLSIFTGALGGIAPFVTVRKLELYMRLGSKSADKTATQYGQVCAALFPSLSALASLIRFRKTAVRVEPDFLESGAEIRLRVFMWLWPFGIAWACLCALIKTVMLWMKLPKASTAKTTVKSDSQQVKN